MSILSSHSPLNALNSERRLSLRSRLLKAHLLGDGDGVVASSAGVLVRVVDKNDILSIGEKVECYLGVDDGRSQRAVVGTLHQLLELGSDGQADAHTQIVCVTLPCGLEQGAD